MIKELYFHEKNVSGHILGNKQYDAHLRALRGIYATDPISRNKFEIKSSDKPLVHQNRAHKTRALEWQKKETKLGVDKENKRILEKINDIQKRPITELIPKSHKQEGYRN